MTDARVWTHEEVTREVLDLPPQQRPPNTYRVIAMLLAMGECERCNGTGHPWGNWVPCPECSGTGLDQSRIARGLAALKGEGT